MPKSTKIARIAAEISKICKPSDNVLLGHEFHHHTTGRILEQYKIIDCETHNVHEAKTLDEVFLKFKEGRGIVENG